MSQDPSHPAAGHFQASDGNCVEIRDVWESNLEEEMEKIREIIDKYPYVAMVKKTPCFFSLQFDSSCRTPNFQEL
jgi:hypothetical protein